MGLTGGITITKQKYYELLIAEEKLTRLENGGVDNWDWYGESLNPRGELSMDEIEEEILNAVLQYEEK